MKTANRMTATFGGAWHPDFETNEGLQEWYDGIGYVFVGLPDGTRMQLFYNHETRLFVADVIAADESCGNEFVRLTVPEVP